MIDIKYHYDGTKPIIETIVSDTSETEILNAFEIITRFFAKTLIKKFNLPLNVAYMELNQAIIELYSDESGIDIE